MLNSLRQFTPTVWLVIVATMVARFTFFMIWPYLAVLLHEDHGLNAWQIGAYISGAGIFGTIAGFYIGYLSDKFGRRRVILVSLALSITSMITLGLTGNLGVILAAMVLQSLARGGIETPGKALMTDVLQDRAAKDLALHARYYALNLGASFGPLVGVYWGLTGQQHTFLLVAFFQAVYLVAALIIFYRIDPPAQLTTGGEAFSFGQVINVLRMDRAFLVFVLAIFCGGLAYAQMETGFIQYLQAESTMDVRRFYPLVTIVNGCTVLVFQFPLLALLGRYQPLYRALIGALLLMASFIILALGSAENQTLLLFAIFVLSLGEVIIFPTIQVLIDRMAAEGMKGSYFGAAGLGGIGFVTAPLLGGWLLHMGGGDLMWWSMVAVSATVAILYVWAERLKRRAFTS